VKYKDGYVVGAVSLSEPERLIRNITKLLLIGSAFYAAGSFVLIIIAGYFIKHRRLIDK